MMKKQMKFRFSFGAILLGLMLVVLAACANQSATQEPISTTAPAAANQGVTPASGKTVSFAKDILPILETSCVSCHGGEKTSKGLDLKSYASLMAGSQNGSVVTAGDATKSALVISVQSGKMPKRGTKLTADQLQLLLDWVNAGAPNN
jgi:uncharacterized membrane protein